MAWVVVDEDGSEHIFSLKPERCRDYDDGEWVQDCEHIKFPNGSIEKLIGKQLTWDDEPVELKD